MIGRFVYGNISLLISSARLKPKLVDNMVYRHKHFGIRFFMVIRPLQLNYGAIIKPFFVWGDVNR